jgi:hypothetical protein
MGVTPSPVTTLRASLSKNRELEADRERLVTEIAKKSEEAGAYLHEWVTTGDERTALEATRSELEAALSQARAVSAGLREDLDASKHRRDPLDSETREALISCLVGRQTPEAVLRLVSVAYPERIEVLPSGFASAKRASQFKYAERLGDLLNRLATDYYDALVDGRGDAVGRAIFGEAFAANESTTTMGSHRGRTARTFRYKGQALVMEKHLRIGAKESAAETIRVHFEWVAAEKKIVIGWCGEHLDRGY